MDCTEARHLFTSGAGSPAPAGRASRLAEAEAHVAACTACRTRLDQLAAAVLSAAEDELSCAECGAQLAGFVEADLAGEDAAAALPLVQAHLAACPECRGDYAEARAALLDLSLGRLPQPEHMPDFDLSFLRPAPRPLVRDLRWLGRAAAVAALLLLCGGVLYGGIVLKPWTGAGEAGDADRPGVPGAARLPNPAVPDPSVQGGQPPENRSSAARPAVAPITRRGAPGLTTPDAELPQRVAELRGRDALGPGFPGQPVGRSPTARAALPPTPVVVPTEPPPTARPPAAGPPSTDEPGDKHETRTPVPTVTPTPVMIARCELRREAPDDGELTTRCDRFPQRSQFDLYAFQVENRSRWAFSLCNRTSLDTIIAIYAAGTFDRSSPCQGIVAYNDDYCNVQSRLTVVLDPGTYWLVIAEKYGDVSAPYAFKTEAEVGALGSQCPESIPAVTGTTTPVPSATATPTDAVTATPTPTEGATSIPPDTATPAPTVDATATASPTAPAP